MAGPGAATAHADGITVWPATPPPGARIHIAVPGCSVGPTAHVARSDAFTKPVTLYGKGDAGQGDPRLKNGLRPGRYAITASCGGGVTVRGEVTITAGGGRPRDGAPGTLPGASHAPGGGPPAVHTEPVPGTTATAVVTTSARPAAAHGSNGGSGLAYWLAGGGLVVLLGGAGLLARRRRGGA